MEKYRHQEPEVEYPLFNNDDPKRTQSYTHKEAASILDLSIQRVWQLAHNGELETVGASRPARVSADSIFRLKQERHRRKFVPNKAPNVFEQLYDRCKWCRKFHGIPPMSDVIRHKWHIFREQEMHDAIRILPTLKEETEEVCRALFLSHNREILYVTEDKWEEK